MRMPAADKIRVYVFDLGIKNRVADVWLEMAFGEIAVRRSVGEMKAEPIAIHCVEPGKIAQILDLLPVQQFAIHLAGEFRQLVELWAALTINVERDCIVVIAENAVPIHMMPDPLYAFRRLRSKIDNVAKTPNFIGFLGMYYRKQRFVVAVDI